MIRRFFGLVVASFAAPTAAFLAGPILARALGPAGRGELAAAASTVVLITILASAGLPDTAAVTASRWGTSTWRFARRHLVRVIFFAVAATTITLLLAWLYRETPGTSFFLLVAGSVMPLLILIEIGRGSAKGLHATKRIQFELYTANVGRLALIATFSALGVLTGESAALATLFPLLLGGVVYFTLRGSEKQLDVSAAKFEESRSSYRFLASNFGRVLNERLDQVVMLPLAGPTQLGYYAVAISLAQLVPLGVKALRLFIFQRATRDQSGQTSVMASRLTLIVVLVAVTCLQLACEPVLLFLFTASFESAVPVTRILLFAMIPFSMIGIYSDGLVAVNRIGLYAAAEWASLVLNCALLIALVPLLGAIGAAIASLSAYSITAIATMILFSRTVQIPVTKMIIPGREDIASIRGLLRPRH